MIGCTRSQWVSDSNYMSSCLRLFSCLGSVPRRRRPVVYAARGPRSPLITLAPTPHDSLPLLSSTTQLRRTSPRSPS